MKAFKDFMEALTLQQRRKRSITSKKKAKITAIKRKKSMRKPPTPDKVEKAVNKAVRQKAIDLVDKGADAKKKRKEAKKDYKKDKVKIAIAQKKKRAKEKSSGVEKKRKKMAAQGKTLGGERIKKRIV